MGEEQAILAAPLPAHLFSSPCSGGLPSPQLAGHPDHLSTMAMLASSRLDKASGRCTWSYLKVQSMYI